MTGQVPGKKLLPAMGLPWLRHLLYQQSQASWQHAEKKANLHACLHLLSFPALMNAGSLVLSVANAYSQF